jgi:hypothetical protein
MQMLFENMEAIKTHATTSRDIRNNNRTSKSLARTNGDAINATILAVQI